MPRREPDDLRELGARLDQARGDKRVQRDQSNLSGLAIGFRLVTELVAAVSVGLGLGWLLDWAFGVRLVFMLVMFAIGVAAGVLNAMKVGRRLNEQTSRDGKES